MQPDQQPQVPPVQPQQTPYYTPPAPQQPSQPDLNFANPSGQQQPAPAPAAPPAPQPSNEMAEIKQSIAAIQAALPQQPQPAQQAQPQAPDKASYDDWGTPDQPGTVFGDVKKMIDDTLQANQQQTVEQQQAAQKQEREQQAMIDQTLEGLRQANYLPPVTNAFNPDDPGKLAEQELIGFAVKVAKTADLGAAAQLLYREHSRGSYFDLNTGRMVDGNQPQQPQAPNLFGQPPANPDQPTAPQFNQAVPQYPQAPVGPQNPYMMQPTTPQYPQGFNAPVARGGGGPGMQGGVPPIQALRGMNMDQVVDTFNQTQ